MIIIFERSVRFLEKTLRVCHVRAIGFYTLCATSFELTSLPTELTKRLPRYPEIPAILVGRLAREIDYPGLGALLLYDTISRCV